MASCRWMCNIVWTSPSRTIFLILTNCGSDMYRATVQCCTRISIKPLPSYHATTVSRTHVLLVIECTSKVFVKCGQDVKTHYSNPVHPCTSNSDSTMVRVQLSFLMREPGSKIWSWGRSLDCVFQPPKSRSCSPWKELLETVMFKKGYVAYRYINKLANVES